jgi:hypothetical protein
MGWCTKRKQMKNKIKKKMCNKSIKQAGNNAGEFFILA